MLVNLHLSSARRRHFAKLDSFCLGKRMEFADLRMVDFDRSVFEESPEGGLEIPHWTEASYFARPFGIRRSLEQRSTPMRLTVGLFCNV